MSGGSPVGSQEPGQRGLTPTQREIAIAHQTYRKFIGAPPRKFDFAEKPFLPSHTLPSSRMRRALKISGSKVLPGINTLDDAEKRRKLRAAELQAKSIKEFLRGQFLNQFIETGNYDRKAAAAEFKAKYNPYAEEEKADAEADQRKKPFLPSHTLPSSRMIRALEISGSKVKPGINSLADAEKRVKLRAVESEATVPVVPEEGPTPKPEVTTPEIITPVPATGSKVKPGINSLADAEKRVKLRAAELQGADAEADQRKKEAAETTPVATPEKKVGLLIKRGVNFLGRKFFGQ